ERRTIPLSGVARVDWLVAGSAEGGRGLAAPASAEVSRVVPYAGLEAQAQGGSGGPRLTWTTASHEGLWGWAVFREEGLADGRSAGSPPGPRPRGSPTATNSWPRPRGGGPTPATPWGPCPRTACSPAPSRRPSGRPTDAPALRRRSPPLLPIELELLEHDLAM